MWGGFYLSPCPLLFSMRGKLKEIKKGGKMQKGLIFLLCLCAFVVCKKGEEVSLEVGVETLVSFFEKCSGAIYRTKLNFHCRINR